MTPTPLRAALRDWSSVVLARRRTGLATTDVACWSLPKRLALSLPPSELSGADKKIRTKLNRRRGSRRETSQILMSASDGKKLAMDQALREARYSQDAVRITAAVAECEAENYFDSVEKVRALKTQRAIAVDSDSDCGVGGAGGIVKGSQTAVHVLPSIYPSIHPSIHPSIRSATRSLGSGTGRRWSGTRLTHRKGALHHHITCSGGELRRPVHQRGFPSRECAASRLGRRAEALPLGGRALAGGACTGAIALAV